MVDGGLLWYWCMCFITIFNIGFCTYIFSTRHWSRRKKNDAFIESNDNLSAKTISNNDGSESKYLQQLIPTNINELGDQMTAPLKQQSAMNICCWIFVLVAAYRSVMPRIDVPRICWYNTPLNYILWGRLSATIAEICWAFQISIVLSNFAHGLAAKTTYKIALLLVPLACFAECFSWTCLSIENQLYCSGKLCPCKLFCTY